MSRNSRIAALVLLVNWFLIIVNLLLRSICEICQLVDVYVYRRRAGFCSVDITEYYSGCVSVLFRVKERVLRMCYCIKQENIYTKHRVAAGSRRHSSEYLLLVSIHRDGRKIILTFYLQKWHVLLRVLQQQQQQYGET